MKYPTWIDKYAQGSYDLFAGNVLKAFAPLDFYHFFPLWYDLWIDKIFAAIEQSSHPQYSMENVAKNFPVPSSTRAIMQKIIIIYGNLPKNRRNDYKYKKVINFIVNVLKKQLKKDVFCTNTFTNTIHGSEEVDRLLKRISWQSGNKMIAQELGRLVMGAGALANGLYNDVVTDMAWDSYGPYNTAKQFGEKTILLIRHFPNLKPYEIWPEFSEVKKFKYKEIKIYSIYKNLKCRINWLGCHPSFDKSLVDSLYLFALEVDGKFIHDIGRIKKIKDYYLELATIFYLKMKKLNFEDLKKKVIIQECYQLHKFFNFLGLNWYPTDEMFIRVKNKKLLKNLYPLGKLINFDLYCKKFGINRLKDIYRKKGL